MEIFDLSWVDPKGIQNFKYNCGYCGTNTSPSIGWYSQASNIHEQGYVFICNYCNRPSFAETNTQTHDVINITPSPMLGEKVNFLPSDINTLYSEIRRCSSIGENTSLVLACRKVLMHIAVEQGADEGLSFMSYVEYLDNNGYVPPNGKEWVDHIRTRGNEANHEIEIMTQNDADDLISFLQMLLYLFTSFRAASLKMPVQIILRKTLLRIRFAN